MIRIATPFPFVACLFVASLLGGGLITASTAIATPAAPLVCPTGVGQSCAVIDTPVTLVAGSCGAAAARAAAAQGGQVIGAPCMVKRGNTTMCVVTVLIKDPTGQRPPTRRQITVPAS